MLRSESIAASGTKMLMPVGSRSSIAVACGGGERTQGVMAAESPWA